MDSSAHLAAGPPGDARHPAVRRPWYRYVRWAVAGVLVAAVVLLVGAVTLVPAVTGATALAVPDGSMRPALPAGSLAIVRPEPIRSIEPGDVIAFLRRGPGSPGAGLVTHRVVAVRGGPEGRLFATRGDANPEPDPGVTAAADVRGVLWYHLPWMGTVQKMLAGPEGTLYLIAVLVVLVAGHRLVTSRVRPGRSLR